MKGRKKKTPGTKRLVLAFSIDPELYKKITEYSDRVGYAMRSIVIERAIKEFLDKEEVNE